MKQLLIACFLACPLAMSAPSGTAHPVRAASGHNVGALCTHEGFASYVESDGTLFANAGQCVRYASHGGRLFPKAILTAMFGSPALSGKSISTFLTLSGSGLQAGTPVTIVSTYRTGGTESDNLVNVSSDGSFTSGVLYGCGYTASVSISAQTAYHTTTTIIRSLPC